MPSSAVELILPRPPRFTGETVYQKPVWQMLEEAIDDLGGRATHRQLKSHIKQRYGDVKDITIQCHFILCAVNHPSRVHYGQNRAPRMAGGKYDFLYRPARGLLERYDPDRHGVWGIVRGDDGRPHVGLLEPPIDEKKVKHEIPVLMSVEEIVRRVYRLISGLPRFDYATPPSALPRNAVYFLFEAGEHVEVDGERVDRIVRVGTHRGEGRFPSRIRSHYGNASSLRGHKNTSILRMNVGGALMRRYFPEDERIGAWMTQGAGPFPDIEELVSKYLREIVTFSCIPVEAERDRLELESALIALLAQNALTDPSPDWLGRSAVSDKIAACSMWNVQHVSSKPLSLEQLMLLERFAQTIGPASYQAPSWRVGRAGGWSEPAGKVERETPALQGLTLVVVPCGKSKIWHAQPELGPVQAKEVYTGQPFKANRAYAEKFGHAWVVLSAKYGFVFPEMLLPADYDVTFGDRDSPERIRSSTLKRQVELMRLDLYDNVLVLGGDGYRKAAAEAFQGSAAQLHYPFKGLKQGEMIAGAKRAVETGEAFPA